MTDLELKEKLWQKKIVSLITADSEFIFRDTVEFYIEKYRIIQENISHAALRYLEPLGATDFALPDNTPEKKLLNEEIYNLCYRFVTPKPENKLIDWPKKEEQQLLELLFFREAPCNSEQIQGKLQLLTIEQKEKLLKTFWATVPHAELNFFNYKFELFLDFLEIENLRKQLPNNLIWQNIGSDYGYHTPEEILNSSVLGDYIEVMKRLMETCKKLAPTLSTKIYYLLPLAFIQKVLFTININQLLLLQSPLTTDLWPAIAKVTPEIYQALNKNKL